MIKTPGYRSKRRKIQKELDILSNWTNETEFNVTNISNNITPNNHTHSHNTEKILEISPILHNLCAEKNSLLNSNVNLDLLDDLQTFENCVSDVNSVVKITSSFADINILTKHNANVKNYQENVLQYLGRWAVECAVPHITVNKLLKILKYKANLEFLPKDCRTLLYTQSTKLLNLREINPGIYYHFGLRNGIVRYSSIIPLSECIKIAVGVDGLQITKSSSSQFWPILAYIMPYRKYVFPVGIYYGNEKPYDSNDYLKDFISEALDLSTHGIIINNENKAVKIKVICCDAPAKSFLLRTKGHSGYFSCTRCIHEGEWIHNHVGFSYNENGHKKRTHEDYVMMSNEGHHVSSSISCIALIPNIDIVNLFSLDYMHLVCLGVMKKLLNIWLSRGPSNVRLPSWKAKQITISLLKIKKCITNDFPRKPRGINEVNRFKATEFRQLLLYTGPIVFKNIISDDCYQHFMTLSIAMRIILSSDYSVYSNYANELLK